MSDPQQAQQHVRRFLPQEPQGQQEVLRFPALPESSTTQQQPTLPPAQQRYGAQPRQVYYATDWLTLEREAQRQRGMIPTYATPSTFWADKVRQPYMQYNQAYPYNQVRPWVHVYWSPIRIPSPGHVIINPTRLPYSR